MHPKGKRVGCAGGGTGARSFLRASPYTFSVIGTLQGPRPRSQPVTYRRWPPDCYCSGRKDKRGGQSQVFLCLRGAGAELFGDKVPD